MRVKILIFPLFIGIMLALSIWIVKPLFSETLAKKAELKEREEILAVEQQKSTNAERLFAELTAQTSEKMMVERYLPPAIDEEEIINLVNFLATSSGLSLVGISLEFENELANPVPQAAASDTEAEAASATAALVQTRNVQPSNVAAEIEVSGDYEKIKELIEKLHHVNRLNTSQSSILEKVETKENTEEGEQLTRFYLEATLKLDFNYLKKIKDASGLSPKILDTGRFDTAVLSDIEELTTISRPEIRPGATGRSNPFAKP